MNHSPPRESLLPRRVSSLRSKIFLSFGSLCAVLAAIGGLFFFSLRAIERLNKAERETTRRAIEVPYRLARNAGLRQSEIFRCVAALKPIERESHELRVGRLAKIDAKGLKSYAEIADNDLERQLYAEAIRASKAYVDQTERLLRLNRTGPNAESAIFALTTQATSYERYRKALDQILRVEETEGDEMVSIVAGRIVQFRVAGNVLIGIALIIVLGTGLAVSRMVRRLRQDTRRLRTEVDDHEKARLALQQTEERYRALVDHSPEAILVLCDEKVVFVNPATLKMLGADRTEQLIGLGLAAIIHPADRAEAILRSQAVVDGQEPTTVERRVLRRDGSAVEVESTVISFLYEGKSAVQVILRDNTERKTAEKHLRKAEEKYRSIFDNASEGIFQNTPDGVFISANPALALMLGFDNPEELIRERKDIPNQGYTDPEKRREFERLLEKKDVVNNFEYEVRRKDGSTICVSENVRVVRDDTGKTLYYEGSVQDITERKRASTLLLESEQRLNLAREAAQIGIWDWNVVNNELLWDDRMYALYGTRPQDFSGAFDAWQNGLHPDDRARAEAEIMAAVKGVHGFHTEFRVLWPDGQVRELEAHAESQRGPDGGTARMIGLNWDITERKRSDAEQQVISDIVQSVITATNLDELLEQAWRSIGKVLYAENCFVGLHDAKTDLIHFEFWVDQCDPVPKPETISNGFTRSSYVLRTGQPLLLTNELKAQLFDPGKVAASGSDSASWLGVPLRTSTRTIGVLAVQHYEKEGVYTQRDLEFLSRVGDQIALAIERQQAEETLRESEEKFRQLADNITDAFWIRSPDMKTVHFISAGFELIWGRSTDSLYADPALWKDAVVAEDRERVFAVFEALVEGNEQVSVEYRITRADGVIRWVHTRGFQVRGATGKLIRLIGIVTDITERKQSEEALRRQQSELRVLFDLIPAMIWFKDTENRILRVNERVAVAAGKPIEDIEGRPSLEIYPDDAARFYADDLEVIRSKVPRLGIVEPVRTTAAAGTKIWVQTDKVPVLDPAGRVIGIVVMAQDITDRKRSEEELFESEQMLRSVLDTIPHRVFWKDRNGVFLGANRALAQDAGFAGPEEMVGMADLDASWSEHAEVFRAADQEVMESGVAKLDFDEPLETADGRSIWLKMNKLPLRDREGKVYGVLVLSQS